MREWLSKLPLVGHMFEKDVPELPRIEPSSNPQLNAERQRSQQLEQRLQEVQVREASLAEEVERLTRQGADNEKSLRALEQMLADPERAQNAIVYYQLREIWFSCNKELDQLVKELARHLEKEERHQQLARFRTEQEEEAKRLEQELKDLENEHHYVVERRRKLEQDLSRSQRIWHYFKRKNLEGELDATRLEMAPVEQQLDDCKRRIREVQDRAAPAYDGLSIDGRRQINLAAIALAQYLFLRFQKDNVVDMARSARNKAIHEAYFGPTDECLQIMRLLKEVSGRWRADQERAEKVRRRSRFLRGKVSYKEKMQTVPDLRSMDQLQPSISQEGHEGAGEANPIPVNVLEMDLWDMRRVFL